MQLLTADKQELLEAQGFDIAELTGFDQHSLPFFAHRPLGDKKSGDVVLNVRVGNPASLDEAEATYLARKAFHGMYPWQPGSECMKHSFVTVKVANDGGAAEQSKQAQGCRWCRKKEPVSGRIKESEEAGPGLSLRMLDESAMGELERGVMTFAISVELLHLLVRPALLRLRRALLISLTDFRCHGLLLVTEIYLNLFKHLPADPVLDAKPLSHDLAFARLDTYGLRRIGLEFVGLLEM